MEPSVDFEMNSLPPHRSNSIVGNREGRTVPGASFLALQVTGAIAHLETALATLDGLVADAATDPSSEHVLYQLGEASHLMHHASLVLNDCTEASRTGGVGLTTLAVTP